MVFSTGGFFATYTWWQPWMETVAVVVLGVRVRIVDLGPLPPDDPADNGVDAHVAAIPDSTMN
ncbi:hypothetical protein [Hamadaea tsunoensis]|uniref:hypothetical protein n=1 Tax=Hamadaea tsunoensis TaxID=53368 RepID=UPI000409BBE3|nr:hypothetical protein [Hamadaea tsunoensis]